MMPIYCYQCDECGQTHERVRSISTRNRPGPMCCGQPTQRDEASQLVPTGTRNADYQELCVSLGCHPGDIDAHERAWAARGVKVKYVRGGERAGDAIFSDCRSPGRMAELMEQDRRNDSEQYADI